MRCAPLRQEGHRSVGGPRLHYSLRSIAGALICAGSRLITFRTRAKTLTLSRPSSRSSGSRGYENGRCVLLVERVGICRALDLLHGPLADVAAVTLPLHDDAHPVSQRLVYVVEGE